MSKRALALYPKASEILINRDSVDVSKLGGHDRWRGRDNLYLDSYMYLAISKKLPSLLGLLLQRGHQINDPDFDPYYLFDKECPSLVMSVLLGSSPCAKVPIEDGADVTAVDKHERSVVQLAKINAFASHPRRVGWDIRLFVSDRISAKQDEETLAIIERAFNEKFKGAQKFEDYLDPIREVKAEPQISQEEPDSLLLCFIEKPLRLILTHEQLSLLKERLKNPYLNMKKIWSLSFSEALIMRFLYVLSYALLLSIEVKAFLKGKKQLQMPSRNFLSILAIMLLPIAYGYLKPSLFSGLSIKGSAPES